MKDFFKSIVEDLGFEAVIFDYGVTENAVAKERSLILNSDGLIAILTPDEKNEDGTWRYSQTVNTEISIAYAADKYIQLFAINEVDFSSSQFSQTSTVAQLDAQIADNRFSLDHQNIRKLFKTLLEFKSSIGSLHELKKFDTQATIHRKHVEYTQRMIDMDTLESETRVKAVALKKVESWWASANLDWTKPGSEGLFLKEDALKFILISPENTDCNVTIDSNQNHTHGHKFNVHFSPPIPVGNEMVFGYDRNYANYYPTSKEELQDFIKNGQLKNKIMVKEGMVGQNMTIPQPTDYVLLRLVFPPGYRVVNYKAIVTFFNTESEFSEETQRINSLVRLIHDKFKDQITIEAEIPNPQMHLDYYLLYEPPSQIHS